MAVKYRYVLYDKKTNIAYIEDNNQIYSVGLLLQVQSSNGPIIMNGVFYCIIQPYKYNDISLFKCYLTHYLYCLNNDNMLISVGKIQDNKIEWHNIT